jgi:NAD/NADP transhydrogenase alpha subunit
MNDKESDALAESIADKVSKKISMDHCPFSKPAGLIGALRLMGISSIWGTRAVVAALAVSFVLGAGSMAMAWVIQAVSGIFK